MNTMKIANEGQPPRPAQLTFLAHVDATPHDLEVWETAEVESFEKSWRPDTNMVVQLQRDPAPLTGRIATAALELAAVPVAGAAAVGMVTLGLAAATLLPAAIAVATGVMLAGAGLAAAVHGGSRLVDTLQERAARKEPVWSGTRTFEIGPDTSPRIDSKVVAESPRTEPRASDITRFLAANMQKYPARVTSVLVGGHGLAWQECAQHPVTTLRQCLEDSARQAGRKPDVLVLESCLMSNLESLNTLRDTARYAIVSEETMGASGLPWQEVFDDLPSHGLTAQSFGRRVIDASAKSDQIDTLALIDLQKVAPLASAVEALAKTLRKAVTAGHGDAVRAALDGSLSFPKGSTTADRAWFDVRDLGQITRSVRRGVPDPAVKQAAEQVDACLRDAVVASTSSDGYKAATHISIQGHDQDLDTREYVGETGFREWARLLEDIQEEQP